MVYQKFPSMEFNEQQLSSYYLRTMPRHQGEVYHDKVLFLQIGPKQKSKVCNLGAVALNLDVFALCKPLFCILCMCFILF